MNFFGKKEAPKAAVPSKAGAPAAASVGKSGSPPRSRQDSVPDSGTLSKIETMFQNAAKALSQNQLELLKMFLKKEPTLALHRGKVKRTVSTQPTQEKMMEAQQQGMPQPPSTTSDYLVFYSLFQLSAEAGDEPACIAVLDTLVSHYGPQGQLQVLEVVCGRFKDHRDGTLTTGLHHAAKNGLTALLTRVFDMASSVKETDSIRLEDRAYGEDASPPPPPAVGGVVTSVSVAPPPASAAAGSSSSPAPVSAILADLRDSDGRTLAYLASAHSRLSTLTLLQRYAVDTSAFLSPQGDGATPLHIASAMGDASTVSYLLAAGSGVNTLCSNRRTALFNACKSANMEVIPLLLAAGADQSIGANNGAEPLYCAAQIGHLEVVKLLLRQPGAIVDCRGCGCPPLHIAVLFSHKLVVKELLNAGAAVNATSGEAQNSALSIACQKGSEEIIDMLVKAGADVFAKNISGGTPLHMASWFGFKETLKTLLGYGADPFQADDNGKLAADYADEGFTLSRNPEAEKCAKYLRKKMADFEKTGKPKKNVSARTADDIDEVIREVIGAKLDEQPPTHTQTDASKPRSTSS